MKFLRVAFWHKRSFSDFLMIMTQNTSFFLWGTEQLGHDHRELDFVDCVVLTFGQHKQDEKMDSMTLMASQDICLCLMWAAAAVMRRLRKYPSSSQDSPISTASVNGHMDQVKSSHMINALRDAVGTSGELILGSKRRMLEHTRIDWVRPRQCTLGNAPFSLLCLLDAGSAMPSSGSSKSK